MRSSRWWDLPAALLLLVALMMAASRLIATEWVDHLSLVQTLVVLGTFAGLALGQSIFPSLVATAFAAAYGLFLVPWQLGLTVGHIAEGVTWGDRLVFLSERLIDTLRTFLQQEPVQDPVLFLFTMAALSWSLSVHAGYALTRHASPWRVIVPGGLATLLIQATDPYVPWRAWYLAAYVALSLLLLARSTFLHLRVDWQQHGSRIPPLIALDLGYVTLAVTVMVVLAAWTAPTMAAVMPSAREAWKRSTRPVADRLDTLFASLRRRGPQLTVADYYGGTFGLGRGRKLSDSLVLGVQGPPDSRAAARYYWRARVYEHYDDGMWSSHTLTDTQKAEGVDFDLALPDLEGRRTITFSFTSPDPIVTLFAAPQPVWANKPVEVRLAENPDGNVDIAAFRADPPLSPGQTYLAVSSLSDMTVKELREAGNAYPEWITDRYLQLPAEVTTRTHELAQQLAAGLDTPYDVATIVTEYLRRRIRYSETITDTLPTDQEPLDWFLFDLQLGYCNYYASSEVILLRSAGIPARLAVGFAEGERRSGTNTYIVRQEDAHAWPEVYFPGLGWVEFEPTVSQAPLIRPSGETTEPDAASPEEDPSTSYRDRLEELLAMEEEEGRLPSGPTAEEPRFPTAAWLRWAAVLALVLLLVGVARWRQRRRSGLAPLPVLLELALHRLDLTPPDFVRRWADLARLDPLQRAYLEVDRALVRLDASPAPALTPAERTTALAGLLPLVSEPTHLLLAEYEAATYGLHEHDTQAAREAARSIRGLSRRARLWRLVGRP